MKVIFKKMLDAEFESAARKNYTLDLWVTFVASTVFTVLSFTANGFGWGGFLAALLYFWHRFVVLNVIRGEVDKFRRHDSHPNRGNVDNP